MVQAISFCPHNEKLRVVPRGSILGLTGAGLSGAAPQHSVRGRSRRLAIVYTGLVWGVALSLPAPSSVAVLVAGQGSGEARGELQGGSGRGAPGPVLHAALTGRVGCSGAARKQDRSTAQPRATARLSCAPSFAWKATAARAACTMAVRRALTRWSPLSPPQLPASREEVRDDKATIKCETSPPSSPRSLRVDRLHKGALHTASHEDIRDVRK